jgi:hypothetical protein
VIDKGIRVNAVAPGPVWTPLNPADAPAEKVAEFGSDTQMKRAAQPEELSPAFVFLASPVVLGLHHRDRAAGDGERRRDLTAAPRPREADAEDPGFVLQSRHHPRGDRHVPSDLEARARRRRSRPGRRRRRVRPGLGGVQRARRAGRRGADGSAARVELQNESAPTP